MLNVTITPHRQFLPADAPEQKLFLMLKLRPAKDVSATRPSTTFAFVIDTSGSMTEDVTTGKSKIDVVIESLNQLVSNNSLRQSDRIAIVQFDDTASTIIGLTPATEVNQLKSAISQLKKFSGGTMMGRGMHQALNLLANENMTSLRILIFTDGQTFDEDKCQELAQDFAANGIPITALGVGDYNEDLLVGLSDASGGRCFHVVPGNPIGTQVAITDLPDTLFQEFSQAQQEVITNLALNIKTVAGVKLTRTVRVYPDQAEFALIQQPYQMGNVIANDDTIFILEFTIDSRPTAKVRIAQLGLTYDVPGQNKRGELPPQNVVLQFVAGQMAAQVDQEVMGYVQQSNIAQLVADATKVADQNPQRAEELLETARRMTQRLGNQAMTVSLEKAQDELRKTRKLSSGTRKTVKIGAKGKTIKMSDDINDEL
ncbi:MAG: VWA domain-containing protein [Gloeotrichia echinulata IR180]|jgi:Ca-activated chloride channel family protein|nr:VWA domain-containing protein [Gloeotrichia echinulata DEX184]